MKTIEYSGDGIVLADMKCEQYAKDFLTDPSGKDEQIKVATEAFITAVRVHICEGVIPHTEVEFIYNGQTIRPDKDGRLPVWPKGFCDTDEMLLVRLLGFVGRPEDPTHSR